MPELAEVEFFRRRWDLAAHGSRIRSAAVHERAQVFRGADPAAVVRYVTGAKLLSSATAAKQMLFRFSGGSWLGVHLGMSGELTVEGPDHAAGKHDHLVLRTAQHSLVLNDPRMFGRVQFHRGRAAPTWWTRIAPPILSPQFTAAAVQTFLARRKRAPIKAVLLMQERFPGIGNWMADEILWRAEIHPRRAAGSLTAPEVKRLWEECRQVCRQALDVIAGRGRDLPPKLNARMPKSWLMPHRWRAGGRCPATGVPLVRETIGGRTTCWSPGRQKLRPDHPAETAETPIQGSGKTNFGKPRQARRQRS